MTVEDGKCGFAEPGTFGHECGAAAAWAAVKTSDTTVSGIFYAARCENHRHRTDGDNRGITAWEQFVAGKHKNTFKGRSP